MEKNTGIHKINVYQCDYIPYMNLIRIVAFEVFNETEA